MLSYRATEVTFAGTWTQEIFSWLWPLYCDLVETNTFGLGTVILSWLVSEIQDPPSPGIETETFYRRSDLLCSLPGLKEQAFQVWCKLVYHFSSYKRIYVQTYETTYPQSDSVKVFMYRLIHYTVTICWNTKAANSYLNRETYWWSSLLILNQPILHPITCLTKQGSAHRTGHKFTRIHIILCRNSARRDGPQSKNMKLQTPVTLRVLLLH
jgi:hypothetical protein